MVINHTSAATNSYIPRGGIVRDGLTLIESDPAKEQQVIEQRFHPSHRRLRFAYHEKLHDYYIQVIDNETNQVIREIPSKKILDHYAAIAERFGLAVDEKI
jgi:flagellar protein FlaG